jgi:hypothetical protein
MSRLFPALASKQDLFGGSFDDLVGATLHLP